MNKYTNRAMVVLQNGAQMEFDTDLTPTEIYESVDSKGFINQSIVVFKLSDVSYIADLNEFGDDEEEQDFTKAELMAINRMSESFSEMCVKWNGANVYNTAEGIVDVENLLKKLNLKRR